MSNLIEFIYDVWNKHFNFALIVYVFVVPLVYQIISGNEFIRMIYALLSIIIIFIALTLMLCQIRLQSMYYQRRLGRLVSIIIDSGLISSINIIIYHLFLSRNEVNLLVQSKFPLFLALSSIVSMILFTAWILIFYYIRGYEINLYNTVIASENYLNLSPWISLGTIFSLSLTYGISVFIFALFKFNILSLSLYGEIEFFKAAFIQLSTINILTINGLFFIVPLIIMKSQENTLRHRKTQNNNAQSRSHKLHYIVILLVLILPFLISVLLYHLVRIYITLNVIQTPSILLIPLLTLLLILNILSVSSLIKGVDPLFKDTILISLTLLLIIPLSLNFLNAIYFSQTTNVILEYLTIHYIFAVSFSYRSIFELKIFPYYF